MPSLSLEVKKVISPTQLMVGPVGAKMTDRQNLSQYTLDKNPTIRAEEQDRPGIPTEQHERAVYAEEPILAKRTIAVDEFGNYYNDQNLFSVNVASMDSDITDPFSAPFDTTKLQINRSGTDFDIFTYSKESNILKVVKVTYSASDKKDVIQVELV
jgi:hypothetical protein